MVVSSAQKVSKQKSVYKPIVPAVEQASRLLMCLGNNADSKLTLTDICNQINIHKSKGYSILNTFIQFGFVEKDPISKTYSLGPGILFLTRHVFENLDIRKIATPFLEHLANETQSTALLGIIENDQVTIAGKYEGDANIGVTIRLGHRFHITLGAHGKSLIAFLPRTDCDRIMESKHLFFHGSAKNLDLNKLKREVRMCKKNGYATDTGDIQSGVNAVSAPVFNGGGKITSSIILIGTFNEDRLEEYGKMVANTAREVSQKLGANLN